MTGRQLSPQTVRVLGLLAREPAQWCYGYDLCRRSGLKSGSVYPMLMRLVDQGALEARSGSRIRPGSPGPPPLSPDRARTAPRRRARPPRRPHDGRTGPPGPVDPSITRLAMIRLITAWLPPHRREWGLAMEAEYQAIEGRRARTAFLVGCRPGRAVVRPSGRRSRDRRSDRHRLQWSCGPGPRPDQRGGRVLGAFHWWTRPAVGGGDDRCGSGPAHRLRPGGVATDAGPGPVGPAGGSGRPAGRSRHRRPRGHRQHPPPRRHLAGLDGCRPRRGHPGRRGRHSPAHRPPRGRPNR